MLLVPLYTCISPHFTIHAKLDVASFVAYIILHLIVRLPFTIIVRTPFITNVELGQLSIVRLPFTASTFLLPFTAYCSNSPKFDTTPDTQPLITGIITLVLVDVLLFDVVEVLILVATRNHANGLVRLRNVSSDLLADEPIEDTTAADTRTGTATISVLSVTMASLPSVPVLVPKNALFNVTNFEIH